MRVTDAPVEQIDFDWVNTYKRRISQRLPAGFLKAYTKGLEDDSRYIDYITKGGNRFVGRIHKDGHLDFIVNPEPEMLKEEHKEKK